MNHDKTLEALGDDAANWSNRLCSILSHRAPLISHREAFIGIRDEVHRCLRSLEALRLAEDLDSVYMPLFDGLAELTYAMRKVPYDRPRMEIARDLFQEACEIARSPLLPS